MAKFLQNQVKRRFQHKILKNPVKSKKGLSQPTVHAKRIFKQEMAKFLQNAVFDPKWCKTQKTLLSTQNIEKSSLEQKGCLSTYS